MDFTEDQITAVRGIYERANGRHEAVVFHKLLPKTGASKLFPDGRSARVWKLGELERLNAMAPGDAIPAATQANARLHLSRPLDIRVILRTYRDEATNLSRTMKRQADSIRGEAAFGVQYEDVTLGWARKLVASYKTGAHPLKPQTIRKKIDCLRLALDWYHGKYWGEAGLPVPVNPLTMLGPKFSKYEDDDPNRRENVSRQARVTSDMEASILAVFDGTTKRKCNRPVVRPDDALMLWRLLRGTGMRLREAYTLRMRSLDLTKGVIRIEKSKLSYKGTAEGSRSLPIPTRDLYLQLQSYTAAKTPGSGELVFPYLHDPKALDDSCFEWKPAQHWMSPEQYQDHLMAITGRMSQMFGAIHGDAGCPDLTTHDLRHEGVSRWCEMRGTDGRRRYNKKEVMTFTGHSTESSFNRYLHYYTEDMVPEGVLG